MEFETFKILLTVFMAFMAIAVVLFMIRQFVKSQRMRIAEGYKQIDALREEIRNSKRFFISQKFALVFSKSQDALLRMKAEKITPYKENFMILAEVPTLRGISEKLQIEFKETEKGTMVIVHAKPVSKLPVGLDDLEGVKIIEQFYNYLNESFLLLFPQNPSSQEERDSHLDKTDIKDDINHIKNEFDTQFDTKLDDIKYEEKYTNAKKEEAGIKSLDEIQIKEVKNDFERYRELYLRQKGNLPPKQKSSILDEKNVGIQGLEKIGIEHDQSDKNVEHDKNENIENTRNQTDKEDKEMKKDKEDTEVTQEKSKDKSTELAPYDKTKSEMKIVDLAELRKKKE